MFEGLVRVKNYHAAIFLLLLPFSSDAADQIESGIWPRILENIEKEQYQVSRTKDAKRSWKARNHIQNYDIRFTENRILVADDSRPGSPNFGLSLKAWGYEGQLATPPEAQVHVENSRVEYQRGTITEWYVNRPNGLEQGFTIAAPPPGKQSDKLELALQLSGASGYRLDKPGQRLSALDNHGNTIFTYSQLKVWDALNKPLPAFLKLAEADLLTISIEDSSAVYPITIDPVISSPDHVFRGPYSSLRNTFGYSVAIDGDTAVVGAYQDEDAAGTQGTGSVYIFERDQGGADQWGLVKEIVPSDLLGGNQFGYAVDIQGNVVVVGAPMQAGSDDTLPEAGAVYIFARNSGGADNWGQVKEIQYPAPGAHFGYSVALNATKDLLVVGAPTFATFGSVYVYQRDSGGTNNWGQADALTYSEGQNGGANFGASVGISNDTIIAGAPQHYAFDTNHLQGAAVVFEQDQSNPGNWDQATILYSSGIGAAIGGFGQSVSIDGDLIAVGFPGQDDIVPEPDLIDVGSVYIFEKSTPSGSWSDGYSTVQLFDASEVERERFGKDVSLDGTTVLIGVDGEAGEHKSVRHGRDQGGMGNWGLIDTQIPSVSNEYFGRAVALDGNTLLIGAPDLGAVNIADSGSAFIFVDQTETAAQQTELSGNNVAEVDDHYGKAVTVSGDTIAIGAPEDDTIAADAGAVYVFDKDEGGIDNWGQVIKLFGSTAGAGDLFGTSIDLSGDRLAVGAPGDVHIGSAVGSVFIFERNLKGPNNWGERKWLTYTDVHVGSLFGSDVALDNDTLVVGRPGDSGSGGNSQGSAYLFQKDEGSTDNWGLVKKLVSSDLSDLAEFGTSVDIDGNTVVIGSPFEPTPSDTGAAYIFERNSPTNDNWGEVKKLLPSTGAANDEFGHDVAIEQDTIIVGAPENGSSGSAYIYERNNGGNGLWGETAQLSNSSTLPGGDFFGTAVAISGDFAVVGAPGSNQVQLFNRNRDGSDMWGRIDVGYAPSQVETSPGDSFGESVAINGRRILAGKGGYNADSSGYAILWNLELPPQITDISVNTGSGSISNGGNVDGSITQIIVKFDQAMNPDSAIMSDNYALISAGSNNTIESSDYCSTQILSGDDSLILLSGTYDAINTSVTLDINSGTPLPDGNYLFLACSGAQLLSEDGLSLDGNANGAEGGSYAINFSVGEASQPEDDTLCFPINFSNGNTAVICL